MADESAASRIAEIEKRLAAITPGPWKFTPKGYLTPIRVWRDPEGGHAPIAEVITDIGGHGDANAAFIAAAPEDLAFLLKLGPSLPDPGGWIATSDEPPQTGAECLIVYDGVVQRIAYQRMGMGFACADGYEWRPADEIVCDPIHDSEVTHWRPLPTPPVREQP